MSLEPLNLPFKFLNLLYILLLDLLDRLYLVQDYVSRELAELFVFLEHCLKSFLDQSLSFEHFPHLIEHNSKREEIEKEYLGEPLDAFAKSGRRCDFLDLTKALLSNKQSVQSYLRPVA